MQVVLQIGSHNTVQTGSVQLQLPQGLSHIHRLSGWQANATAKIKKNIIALLWIEVAPTLKGCS
jgi:hypothetical protein